MENINKSTWIVYIYIYITMWIFGLEHVHIKIVTVFESELRSDGTGTR